MARRRFADAIILGNPRPFRGCNGRQEHALIETEKTAVADMTPAAGAGAWPRWLAWALALAAFANAMVFTRAFANPMIMADNWLFVDTFLRHVLDGDMGLGDFLVKRTGLDHGLPHYKLLMLLNAHFLGLDFRFEAMAGVVFAFAGWLALYRTACLDVPRAGRGWAFHLAVAAMAAIYLSVNARYIYLYSMVTLSHLSFLLALLLFLSAWRALVGGARWPFAALALLYAVCADTSATVTAIGLVMALALAAWHLGHWRRALQLAALLLASLVLSRLLYLEVGTIRGETLAVFNVPLSERIRGLAAIWTEAWQWAAKPLASGVAGRAFLRATAGDNWVAVQALLASVVAVAHLWFWGSALRHRPRAASFVAICLMLLFYGYVAGVLYGRVFLRGSEYLDQERYVTLYQLGVVALLLMAVSRLSPRMAADGAPGASKAGRRLLAGVAIALVLVQVPITRSSWRPLPEVEGYYLLMARQYGAVLRDPEPRRTCVDQLTLCELPPEIRLRVLAMLRDHRLNLYSPTFQARHPELADAAAPIPAVGAGGD
jgi:hypothetical protein